LEHHEHVDGEHGERHGKPDARLAADPQAENPSTEVENEDERGEDEEADERHVFSSLVRAPLVVHVSCLCSNVTALRCRRDKRRTTQRRLEPCPCSCCNSGLVSELPPSERSSGRRAARAWPGH